MDIRTELFGMDLQSPFIIGSGPLSYGAEGMLRLHAAGAGAVVTKTIRDTAADNPFPHIAAVDKGTLINAEKWSDYNAERWIETEIPTAKQAGVVVGASLGHTPEEVGHWIEAADKAGADFFELVSYHPETIRPMAELAKQLTEKPVVVKISPNWPDAAGCAIDLLEMGVDGITAIDSIGPVLSIDIKTARPRVGGQAGFGWLTGSAIKPLALRYVAEIASRSAAPVIGLGGVMRAEDAVEMLMAGAAAVGVCTAPMLRGVEYLRKLNTNLARLVETLGYSSLAEVRGAALAQLYPQEVHRKFSFKFDSETCIWCGRCVEVCPYAARSLNKSDAVTLVDAERCRYCGLCTCVCPTAALTKSEV
ncbi:MAG: 4Fe-4S binding protein [Spirochaetia bacterium]